LFIHFRSYPTTFVFLANLFLCHATSRLRDRFEGDPKPRDSRSLVRHRTSVTASFASGRRAEERLVFIPVSLPVVVVVVVVVGARFRQVLSYNRLG
jgi:hypothetical protein